MIKMMLGIGPGFFPQANKGYTAEADPAAPSNFKKDLLFIDGLRLFPLLQYNNLDKK
jgi:hypothetical protein